MTLDDNIVVDVGRTLVKPWKDDIPWQSAMAVTVVFVLLVWWATDALLIHGRLLKAAEALIPGD
jgi:hypothetical protein